MKYLLLSSLLVVTACSSPSGRAPVYDVKSASKGYVAAGATIKPGQETYIVRNGDTLYSIAWRAGTNVNTLIKRNNLKKPYVIKVGQLILLKGNTPNSVFTSQNNQKDSIISCTAQTCEQNHGRQVVKILPKDYSEGVVDKKNIKSSKPIPKPTSTIETKAKVTDWQWPSKGTLIKTFASSTQGMRGISISNVRGTPIYAAADGEVVYAGSGLRGYGNLIIIKHNYDYLSAYAHNDQLLIKENQHVKIGQKIALMGSSGTDNVYLHFDIRYRGKSVDPLRYLPKR